MNQKTVIKVAEVDLVYKTNVKSCERPKISNSHDSYKIFLDQWDKNKIEFVEQFKVMLLNRANKVLGIYEVSTGSVSGCIVDPKQIFCAAIKTHASGIIAAHNHPSSSLIPSAADRAITQKLKSAGEFLDIKVFDHLIISLESFYSFADEGLL